MRHGFSPLVAAAMMVGSSSLVLAQETAPPGARGLTRDAFVQRATEAAGKRFDQIDTNHDGVLSQEEQRAWRSNHQRQQSQSHSADPAKQER